jgi:hypothetical protein
LKGKFLLKLNDVFWRIQRQTLSCWVVDDVEEEAGVLIIIIIINELKLDFHHR